MSKKLVEQIVAGALATIFGTLILAWVQSPGVPGPALDLQPKMMVVQLHQAACALV
jgi:hypothetical protein